MNLREVTSNPPSPRPLATVLVLTLLGLVLYLPGINWGLPAVASWSQDTIAGVRTLGAMETWPDRWMGRYPPLHYMILRAAYEPALFRWRATGQIHVDPQSGEWQFAPPHAPKVGLLLKIAGAISAAMGIGAGLVLLFAARRATGDLIAGAIAGAAFMGGAAFTYFAHLGNVDVPSTFWFSLSLLCYVRLLSSRAWSDAALLGLFAALTVCTKDGWIGLYPGMALVLLMSAWGQGSAAKSTRRFVRALLQWRWLVGIGAFAVPYVLINGIVWNPRAYVNRLGGWLSPAEGAWITREHRHDSLSLAIETMRQAAAAVGWPMLFALITAAVYALLRRPRLGLAMLVPAASYYLIVIERIDFVYERFLFAPLMLLCVLLGAAGADLLRNARIPMVIRAGLAILVFLPTVGYAAAIDLEMRNDSRYVAEQWFAENVPKVASVGALAGDPKFFSPQYLPRLHEMGYATYPVVCAAEEFQRPQPDYLVLSGFDHQDFDAEAMRCAADLLAGRLGYESVAAFRSGYLGTGSSWWSIAGWGAPVPGKISPTISVLRRRER